MNVHIDPAPAHTSAARATDSAEPSSDAAPRGVRIDVSAVSRRVQVRKRERTLLEDVSFTIRAGELVAIVGPSGAGKTTLLEAIAGTAPATSGSVRFDGVDVYSNLGAFRSVLGYVPQDDIIHADLPLSRTLHYAARLRLPSSATATEVDDAVRGAMDAVGLTDHADVRVGSLSGGQRKRASIAVELLTDPHIFFLDEPTSGLDPQSRLALWDVVNDLHAQGETIVLTTHYMEEADQLCDRVAIIDHGELLALDTPEKLKAGAGADTELRINATGDLQALANDLTAMPGIARALVVDGTAFVYVSPGGPTLPEVIAYANDHGFTITDVAVKETTLETVFINLTGRELRE